MIQRRQFISLLGGAAVAWPVAARAQQSAMPVIGYLSIGSLQTATALPPFLRGLRDGGFVEGQNVTIEYRFYANNEQVPALAAELVRRQVAVIFSPITTGAIAAKAATSIIPIVFRVGDDPIKNGLVSSYNYPGGNATGVTVNAIRLEGKRLAMLRELVAKAELIAALVNPKNNSSDVQQRDLSEAAHSVGRKIEILLASSDLEIDDAFKSAVQKRAGALIIASDALFYTRRHQIIALAAHYAIPTIYQSRDFVEGGGLISYGTDYSDMSRQCGIYVGRILRGEKPADLPVVQPTKFELVVNLKTTKALGLEIPPMLLALADEVIE